MKRILVIGATGRVGCEVVRQLLDEKIAIRALARRPESASLPDGVEVVRGDLTEPDSIAAAAEGIDAAFLLWTAPSDTAPAVIRELGARVRRIVYLSAPFTVAHPFFQQPNRMADMHAQNERLLAAEAIERTILRPGMFASNTVMWWAAQIAKGNIVRWPYAAVETAPIDERDIAAVAVRALVDDGHDGGDYVITGPAAITHEQQLHAIGAALGRNLQYVELTPDEFRREMPWPPPVIEMLLNAWSATLGHPAHITDTFEKIAGRPARTFEQWASDSAKEFR